MCSEYTVLVLGSKETELGGRLVENIIWFL